MWGQLSTIGSCPYSFSQHRKPFRPHGQSVKFVSFPEFSYPSDFSRKPCILRRIGSTETFQALQKLQKWQFFIQWQDVWII